MMEFIGLGMGLGRTATGPLKPRWQSRGLVSTRTALPMVQTPVGPDGGAVQLYEQSVVRLAVDCSAISVLWQNLCNQTADEKGENAYDIKASIFRGTPWTAFDQFEVLTFAGGGEGGQRSPVVAPGAMIESDHSGFGGAKGARTLVRRWLRATADWVHYPVGEVNIFDGDEVNQYKEADGSLTLSDRIGSADWAGVWYSRNMTGLHVHGAPIALVGDSAGRVARCALLTDSIGSGSGDTQSGEYTSGWLQRLLAGDYPNLNIGCGGYSLTALMADSAKRAQRMASFSTLGITHVIAMIGSNDFYSSRTAAQFLADLVALQGELARINIRLIPCTVPPRTNVANTASVYPGAGDAERQSLNATLVADQGVGHGVFDFAGAVAQPGRPDLWRNDSGAAGVNGSGDGVHPNSALHQNVAYVYLAGGQAALLTTDHFAA